MNHTLCTKSALLRIGALLAFLAILVAPDVFSQSGIVVYDKTVKIEIKLPPQMAHMKDQIPTSRTTQRMLNFSETASVMRDAPEEEADEEDGVKEFATSGGMIRFRAESAMANMPEEMYYTSLESGMSIEQKNFLGRTFVIEGEQKSWPWKLTGEQGEFEGYLIQKATATVDSTHIEAWFTPEIPVSFGPDEYGGLPGLILVLSVDDGKQQYAATQVDLEAAPEIVKPDEGRRVSREEYDSIVKEKQEELRRQGRAGGVHFKINN